MDEQEALRAEIGKLSGAIQNARRASYYHHQPSYRGTSRGRARGRGAPLPQRNRTLILNSTTANRPDAPAANPSTDQAAPSKPDGDGDGDGDSAVSSSAAPSGSRQTAAASIDKPPTNSEGWIKRRTTHNMSLVSSSTFHKTEPARLAAIAATQAAKAEARAKAKAKAQSAAAAAAAVKRKTAGSSSIRRGDNMGEVVIDGVVFEFDPSGTKLLKKAPQPSSSSSEQVSAAATTAATAATASASASSAPLDASATPLRTSINGQSYIRTKRGNLVSAELVAKRRAQKQHQNKLQKLARLGRQVGELQAARYGNSKPTPRGAKASARPKGLCSFFNKTGQCKRGLSCPFIHDSTKISLCPRVLRPKGCTLPPGTCPLSHDLKPERVPHCVHYLRSGSCRNGDDCVYTHADLAEGLNTKICADFSKLGWCDKGAACTERHTWECPEFAEKGKCGRKGCRLLHVIRAKTDSGSGTGTGTGTGPGLLSQPGAVLDSGEGEGEMGHMQDGDLFMRDDAAANEPLTGEEEGEEEDGDGDEEEEDEENGEGSTKKRKRESGLGYENLSLTGKHKRKRQGKAFAGQKDFISFSDEEDLEGDEEDDEEHADHGSVHSEELELTDDEEEEEEKEDEASEAGDDASEGKQESDEVEDEEDGNDDDDDDAMVDRDL